jgi:hypothetical protein
MIEIFKADVPTLPQVELIAATLNQLPRLIEYGKDFVQKNLKGDISQLNLPNLYEYITFRLDNMYQIPTPPKSLLFDLVYGNKIPLSQNLLQWMTFKTGFISQLTHGLTRL